MMRASILGSLAICVAAILWGLDGVVLTPRLSNLDVPFVVFLLHAVPFLVMQVPLWRCWSDLRAVSAAGWGALMLVAVSGGLLGTFSIVHALFLVGFNQVSVVVLLQKLQPVFAILLASVVLGERVSPRFLSRAGVALVGAYLLTFGLAAPDFHTGATTARAALWAAVAAASFGAATVFGKKLLGSLDFLAATFGRYGLTSLLALAYLVTVGGGLPFGEVTRPNWIIIVVIGLTTGSGALFLYYFGLTRVPARVSAVCEMCLPLSAILLDYLVNDSVLGPWQWVGAAVMMVAIMMVSLTPARTS